MLFLTSLGAIFPDLDLFTSGHRAYLHSFYYPIILALIAPEIGKRVKFQNFAIHLRLFSVFWFTHMIFDMTFGPIALFFPLDTRFYDISAGIIFDLRTAQITPRGLFIGVDFVDQRTGINTFFVNWTPEDRVQYFGAEFIKWSISDFFLHSALILWYVLYVISPLVREKKWRKPVSKISDFGFHIRMMRWQTPILLFILTTSIFLGGPIHGNSWEEQSSFRVEIGVASDFVQPYGSVQVNSPEGSQLTIDVSSQSEDLNYSIFVLPVEETIYNQLRSQTKDLIVSLDNGTMTFTEYRVEYLEVIHSTVERNTAIEANDTGKWSFATNTHVYYLIFGLYEWDPEISFRNSISFSQNWEIPLTKTYRVGWILFVVSSIVLVISAIITRRRSKLPVF